MKGRKSGGKIVEEWRKTSLEVEEVWKNAYLRSGGEGKRGGGSGWLRRWSQRWSEVVVE